MSRFGEGVRELYSGYFALVMATGIVSIASFRLGYELVAYALLVINVVAYLVLWVLAIARVVLHPRRFAVDLTSHGTGPGFFTVVAGTAVLGSQVLLLTGMRPVAEALWWLATVLWVLIIYTFFTAITVRETKPTIDEGLSGAWLIAVVATQSVPVLGGLLALSDPSPHPVRLFFLLAMYLLGGMLYLLIINLIVYRFAFFTLPPETLTPPYWINMGAVAITTLAGSTLVLLAPKLALLTSMKPFVAGLTLFFWATATWWIPLLFLLGAWRHLVRKVPLRYHPAYWGMVFPLGMYTACTLQLSQAIEVPFLVYVAEGFVFLALAAWLASFVGLVHGLTRLGRTVTPAPRS
jgi:tellurite resistance protein TehA-like permease